MNTITSDQFKACFGKKTKRKNVEESVHVQVCRYLDIKSKKAIKSLKESIESIFISHNIEPTPELISSIENYFFF